VSVGSIRTSGPGYLTVIFAIAAVYFADVFAADEPGLSASVPVGPFLNGVFPSQTPYDPAAAAWTVVPVFPKLRFESITVIASHSANDRLYVASRDGHVVGFDNRPDVEKIEKFLDLRGRVAVRADSGFLGLTFHPEFGNENSPFRRDVYVYYTSNCPLNAARDAVDLTACYKGYPTGYKPGFSRTYLRLSRFRVPDGATAADPNSEKILLNLRQYTGRHAGGGIVFGNDRHLYLAIGDQWRFETAQEIIDTLEGGTMRISVDVAEINNQSWTCPAGTHEPRRRVDTIDEISGRFYCIPNDNPWLSKDGALFEEYFSVGQRNPYRLSNDAVTGQIWSGEVGHSSREEVNIVAKRNNYGWPFREGMTDGVRPKPAQVIGTLTNPIIDFRRNEAGAIIGGYVYRGSRFPELSGRYLAGDYVTNNIWAITLDQNTMTATKQRLTSFRPGQLGTWGVDRAGEVYLGKVVGRNTLYTLAKAGGSGVNIPRLLSEVGAFDDLAALKPSAALVPYQLNQPFWSDGAIKRRWVAVPNDGLRDTPEETIRFSKTGDWTYPIGTVLVKHFELPRDVSDPQKTTRLETRFLVNGEDNRWYGLTYRWLPNQLDARLIATGETKSYRIRLASGKTRNQVWEFPARDQCLRCHQDSVGGALGPRTHQLNGDLTYPSTNRTDNQLRTWNHLGMFRPSIGPRTIKSSLRNRSIEDGSASLEDRARSYLDANCSYCHRPETGNRAGFDARFTTPLEDQNLLHAPVSEDFGIANAAVIVPGRPDWSMARHRMGLLGASAMPPLAKNRVDRPALQVVSSWIRQMVPSRATAALYRPGRSIFYLWNRHRGSKPEASFRSPKGGASWQPIAGDWDGDRVATFGFYNARRGLVRFLSGHSEEATATSYGLGPKGKSMIAIAGDWNGDGMDTTGLYDGNQGRFYLQNTISLNEGRQHLGSGFRYGPKNQQWLPIAGDWNGDRFVTIGLYDPRTGRFHLRNSNDRGPADISFRFGKAKSEWLPLAGDWNADGRDGIGLFDPARKTFLLRNDLSSGAADRRYAVKVATGRLVPIVGDWDGIEKPKTALK